MDQNEMMAAALKSYGASNSPKNIAQLQQFFASNPDQLERRAMGMRGSNGNEDNTDVLGMQLDKLMQASDRPTVQQAVQGAPMAPTAVAPPSPVAARPTASPALVQTQGLGYNPNNNLGPLPARNATPREAGGIPGNVQVQDAEAGISNDMAPASKDWIGPMLLSLLGMSSVAGRNGVGPGGMGPNAPNGPAAGGGASEMTDVAPGRNAVGKAVPQGKPPIVNPPELPNARAGQKSLQEPQGAWEKDPTALEAPQKKLPPPDYKARTQAEYDSGNAELDKYESDIKKERASQLAKEKVGKAARAVKK